MYLTYEEYKNLGGTLDNTTFTIKEIQAQKKIDWYTFNRLKNDTEFTDSVKLCMKFIIDTLVEIDEYKKMGIDAPISSQSNDGVAISYNSLSAKDALDKANSTMIEYIQLLLNGETNQAGRILLYRGIYPDE